MNMWPLLSTGGKGEYKTQGYSATTMDLYILRLGNKLFTK